MKIILTIIALGFVGAGCSAVFDFSERCASDEHCVSLGADFVCQSGECVSQNPNPEQTCTVHSDCSGGGTTTLCIEGACEALIFSVDNWDDGDKKSGTIGCQSFHLAGDLPDTFDQIAIIPHMEAFDAPGVFTHRYQMVNSAIKLAADDINSVLNANDVRLLILECNLGNDPSSNQIAKVGKYLAETLKATIVFGPHSREKSTQLFRSTFSETRTPMFAAAFTSSYSGLVDPDILTLRTVPGDFEVFKAMTDLVARSAPRTLHILAKKNSPTARAALTGLRANLDAYGLNYEVVDYNSLAPGDAIQPFASSSGFKRPDALLLLGDVAEDDRAALLEYVSAIGQGNAVLRGENPVTIFLRPSSLIDYMASLGTLPAGMVMPDQFKAVRAKIKLKEGSSFFERINSYKDDDIAEFTQKNAPYPVTVFDAMMITGLAIQALSKDGIHKVDPALLSETIRHRIAEPGAPTIDGNDTTTAIGVALSTLRSGGGVSYLSIEGSPIVFNDRGDIIRDFIPFTAGMVKADNIIWPREKGAWFERCEDTCDPFESEEVVYTQKCIEGLCVPNCGEMEKCPLHLPVCINHICQRR